MAKLLLTVRHALEASRLKRENIGLRQQAEPVSELVGKSQVVQALREQIRRIASHDTPVLVCGESGSGKRVLARYLHAHSARGAGPFLDVPVGGMSADGAGVELFGSEEQGRVHYGWLEQANGGTLFLNDIAEMAASMQTRFVGTLQHQSFVRVDGKEPVQIDVRIIAATSQDLDAEVAAGRFRDDLFYFLNVVPIQVPPLREHREDVPELLDYYVNLLVQQDKLPYRRFTMSAQNFLRNYPWPGNVRELQNLVQRLLILGSSEEITQDEAEAALGTQPPEAARREPGGLELPLREARELFEKNYLEHQLKVAGGNVSQAAQRIGLERTHLYRKLRALGIDPKKV